MDQCSLKELCRCRSSPSDFRGHLNFCVSTVSEAVALLSVPTKKLFVRVTDPTHCDLPHHIVALGCLNPNFVWLTTEETCQVWLPGVWNFINSLDTSLATWFENRDHKLFIRKFSFQLDALIELAVKGCISLTPLNLLNDPALSNAGLSFQDLVEAAGLPAFQVCHSCFRIVWSCWTSPDKAGCEVCREAQSRYRSSYEMESDRAFEEEELPRRVVLASIAECAYDDDMAIDSKVWKVTPLESELSPSNPFDPTTEFNDKNFIRSTIRPLRSAPGPNLSSLIGSSTNDEHQVIIKLAGSILNELAENSLAQDRKLLNCIVSQPTDDRLAQSDVMLLNDDFGGLRESCLHQKFLQSPTYERLSSARADAKTTPSTVHSASHRTSPSEVKMTDSPRVTENDGDSSYVEKYVKTRMCQQFRLGQCKRGSETCRFAHSLRELRATRDVYKTKLCAFWMVGHCKAGTACRHAHGEQELRRRTPMLGPRKSPESDMPLQKDGIGAGLVVWGTPVEWNNTWLV